jgi:hypothetical protein
MPRIVLVQVKRQMLHFKFRQYFCSTLYGVYLSRPSLDEGGFMIKMGSFVR